MNRSWAAPLAGAVLGALLVASACTVSGTERKPHRPHVIVIVADDHGYADLGSQGVVKDVRTPHLDALASDGVRFTRGYVTAPQCVPSRAGLLTGRYQPRFGVDANKGGLLPLTERTIADRLRAVGYHTGMVGKWHLDGGRGPEYGPGRRGFDEYFHGMMLSYEANYDLKGESAPHGARTTREDRYRVDVQTDAALAFLQRRAAHPTQPFFLYLAYFAPHVPLERPEPYMARLGHVTDETRHRGLAAIAAIDEGVGRIRQFLRAGGLEENTLLFFISDNGAPTRGEVWNGSLNDPLMGEKGMLTDGGVRVPYLAAWKGVLPAGAIENRAVTSLDIAGTALAVAGGGTPDDLDGVNLVPFLTGQNAGTPHEFLYWRWRSQAAVFDGRWKLVRLPPDRFLLFDHAANAPESTDVAARHPEVVARLRTRLEGWAAELTPPGLPPKLANNDRALYDDHLDLFEGRSRRPERRLR